MADRKKLLEALEITRKRNLEGLWDQDFWLQETECGTMGCFAGNWALHRGCTPSSGGVTEYVVDPGGVRRFVDDWVAEDLELTSQELMSLYYGPTDIDDLTSRVMRIVGTSEG